MKIWALSDGKAGHYNQTKAIVKAFESLDSVHLEWLDVELRVGGFRSILKVLLNFTRGALPFWLLSCFYRFPTLPAEAPDCIVSTGGKTLYINAWLARGLMCKNIFSGSLRGLNNKQFTSYITLVPDSGAKNNIILDHAPTLIDPIEVSQSGKNMIRERHLEKYRLWALFVGGDRYGYRYRDIEWQKLAAGLVDLYETKGVHWLLTSSRRTGLIVEKKLQQLVPQGILAMAVWWNEKPQPCMQEFLGAAEQVFVTEDSMAMIADGIASDNPVCTLFPGNPTPEQAYQSAIDQLQEKQLITRLPLDCFSSMVEDKQSRVADNMRVPVKVQLVEELRKNFLG